MKVSRRGRLWGLLGALAAVLAVTLVAAGCGSSSSSSTASSTPSASASSSATVSYAGIAITADPALHQLFPANIRTAGQINVGAAIPYPPWTEFVGTTNQATGFECDLWNAIGTVSGIKTVFTNINNIPEGTLKLESGALDAFMTDVYDTPTREKVMTFVDYAYDAAVILVRKGNPQGLTNLDSLAGKTVAVDIGTSEQLLMQTLNTQFKSAGKKPIAIIAFPNQPDALLALKSGRAVADLTDHSTAEYIAKTTNNGATFEVVQDPAAPHGYEPQHVGAAILKTNTQLVTAVQKAVQELMSDGVYAALAHKYGIIPEASVQINAAAQSASASPTP